ncbi:NFACT RNA binding domain-containing protein [Lactobacillus selangorensis]|uniref:Rqc2 homolog RqcH n=2 Tax=Lactobacillus selangorensis TaxID=81857 RepID=A0A0R2GB57_9LACO|nr:NFACT RNA binding domain-containing protein [Lactobacillus selangorensis]KRN33997.1 fibronectin binding protein A [Lactobacillus selangorensis]
MSFDGVFTHTMTQELQPLVDGKITKIQQPYPNELILTIRSHRKNYPLLLSAHPQYARVQVTRIPYVNPATPSKFTMSLRKYLDGATLQQIKQIDNDRVMHFSFTSRNELGDLQNIRLIVEMMGRHSNVILINHRTNKIIDLIRHVPADQNRYRLLMPGADYVEPPRQNDQNPFVMPFETDLLQADQLAHALQQTYQGFGRDTAQELAYRLENSADVLGAWQEFFAALDTPQPTITTFKGKSQFSAIPYRSEDGTQEHFDSLSVMLDAFYENKAESDRVQQQGANLIHFLKNELQKDNRKMKKLKLTMQSTEKADDYRIRGEVLTTYLSQVERGMTEITLPNFYDDEKPLKIQLSNQLSPSKNAQKYFTKYQKLRNAVAYVTDQMAKTQSEIDYLEGIMTQIKLASPKDLDDIRAELQQQGYLKPQKQGKNKKKQRKYKVNQPDTFYASDGTKILVGKNNLQNEQLTLHKAQKTDIWLHAKDVPGSHVIITDANPTEKTLLEAANLAAYYSKSRDSSNVPVDYIEVKKIRKPNGAKPGFVVYEGQRTVRVTPDEVLIDKLRHQPNM